jgi:RHS repeat-associated protein
MAWFRRESLKNVRTGRGVPSGFRVSILPGVFGMTTMDKQESAKSGSSATSDSTLKVSSISLPKGGGAIRGIGEKFAANPVTGTGSMTVPIATSPGRSGFGPQLSLSYDSGSGNGPFGIGWQMSLPNITRKTDKGLPRYLDAEDSDVFILSGSEDLVPTLKFNNGKWEKETLPDRMVGGKTYAIRRYRPRIEGLFARIERWGNTIDPSDSFWRSISKDNITTWYGRTAGSRIADPDDTSKIFSWLICQSYDDKGNAILYEYEPENEDNLDLTKANERNRVRTSNRYVKRILYGNRIPNRDQDTWEATDPGSLPCDTWMFEVVFDYLAIVEKDDLQGQHLEVLSPDSDEQVFIQNVNTSPQRPWASRQDPFSSYRSGFEVRTYRLCIGALMFHHFPKELERQDYLVRSTEFGYSQGPIGSFITSVLQSGFVLSPSTNKDNRYLKKSLPPLEFSYSRVPTPEELEVRPVCEVEPVSLENLPTGLDGSNSQWVDLDEEGTSGILLEQGNGWLYKRNTSANYETLQDGIASPTARFGPAEPIASWPNLSLAAGAQIMDLAGDGQMDVVEMDGPIRGFYERTDDGHWSPFTAFKSWPNINTRDPNVKFVDVNGDGHADIMVTEGGTLTWYPSLAEDGFGPAVRVSIPQNEERGPRVIFADGTQSIYLADLSGDGLTDLVRIRNGEVCYWPNLGYGHFGGKVTMDHSPWFDVPDQFEQRRIRLADIDGSGTTDIFYLHRDGVKAYFNRSGNAWSDPVTLRQLPGVENVSSYQALDLLGNGTACLVWSSQLPSNARRPMKYLRLMDEKPHLLTSVVNNLGAETRVKYAASTKFYLQDTEAGTPWITHLPFPVHVVERVESFDYISRNRFTASYMYHHGFFDGVEREFRGFGMVEQMDTEEFAALSSSDFFPKGDNTDESSRVPPVVTKTWFHTGAYLGRDNISKHFEGKYYREGDKSEQVGRLNEEQLEAMSLPDTILPTSTLLADGSRASVTLTSDEEREACRALKGSILRQEVYAVDTKADGSPSEVSDRPYTVSERNYTIEVVQQTGPNPHPVLFVHPRETIDFHYERKLYESEGKTVADPRVGHSVNLDVDRFGNIRESVAIGYGRRYAEKDEWLQDEDRQAQMVTYITFTQSTFTCVVDSSDDYRTPLPAEVLTYEIPQQKPISALPGITNLFTFEELRNLVQTASDGSHDIPYEDIDAKGTTGDGPSRRIIERVRSVYRKNDLTALLACGQMESMALPGDSYKLAFTPGLLSTVFRRKRTDGTWESLLDHPELVLGKKGEDGGGYIDLNSDGHWWIPSGRIFYSPGSRDSAPTEVKLARQRFFLAHRFRDPFDNDVTVEYDSDLNDASKNHNLLLVETRDPVGNVVSVKTRDDGGLESVRNDYRVLQPYWVTDPNRNRTRVAFDALGLVVATAVMGKPGEKKGDDLSGVVTDLRQAELDALREALDPHDPAPTLLRGASTRIVYDIHCFVRSKVASPDMPTRWQPAFAATLARETHVNDALPPQGLRIQISFSYSDGFGREIQKKIQAEPGKVQVEDGAGNTSIVDTSSKPRWVGSGWTVFNNKGKPVRQYEPFFSADHSFQFGKKVGVSPILFYDPVERVIATLHPNCTYEKVVFDPWKQASYDGNDTVAPEGGETGDPRSDPDIHGYVEKYFESITGPWQTWYNLRMNSGMGGIEESAAKKTAVHANTPTIAYFDSLGRTHVTFVHNRWERQQNGETVEKDEGRYPTRTRIDIEGNQREIHDERTNASGQREQRIVMQYDYDMLSNKIHQSSMEAGERWMLNDVLGKPIRTWDSRQFIRRMMYDSLRRPTCLFVTESGAERLAESTEYGESLGDARNLKTRAVRQRDAAGIVTNDLYDFKGNLQETSRAILADYRNSVDWLQSSLAVEGTYSTSTEYDALNRPLHVTTPDKSVYSPRFNEANLLNCVEVNLQGSPTATTFVSNIDYNEKGQRKLIEYGNGARTLYEYDPLTFRLVLLNTTRPEGRNGLASQLFKDPRLVQDLHYTYDPAGNITNITDGALPTLQYNNENIEPRSDYTYDALYRLIRATGREHIGQTAFDCVPSDGNYRDYPFVGLKASPYDARALRNFVESYDYDAVGNFETMRHTAANGKWTRSYEYSAESLIESSRKSNRLTRTVVGNGTDSQEAYAYSDSRGNDVHGCMTSINAMRMTWNFKDELESVDLGGGGTAHYVYDASGQRVRKIIHDSHGAKQKERLYLGGLEIYQEVNPTPGHMDLIRQTLHLMDDQQRIALVETRTQGEETGVPEQMLRYQIGNHLGSATLELDAQAELVSFEEYTPYGSSSYQAVRSAAEVPKRYRYTGKERDEESGLCYHGARYCLPWLNRWLNCDQSERGESGANLYQYAADNPVRFFDPDGKTEKERQNALDRAKASIGSQYGAAIPDFDGKYDCSGLVRYAMMKNASTNDPFVGRQGNGVSRIMQASNQIMDLNRIRPGDLMVIDRPGGNVNFHIAMVAEVYRDENRNSYSAKIVHAESQWGPNAYGQTGGGTVHEQTVSVGAVGSTSCTSTAGACSDYGKVDWNPRFYRWDTSPESKIQEIDKLLANRWSEVNDLTPNQSNPLFPANQSASVLSDAEVKDLQAQRERYVKELRADLGIDDRIAQIGIQLQRSSINAFLNDSPNRTESKTTLTAEQVESLENERSQLLHWQR